MAIRLLASRDTTPFPTPMALPPPKVTTTSTSFSSASFRAESTASRGTCGATSVNSATSRAGRPFHTGRRRASRTSSAWTEALRLGVHTNRMRRPSAAASRPARSIAPRPKRTRGAMNVQLLGERTALHHFEWIGLDLQQFPIRALEIQRVLDPIRTEILDVALVELPTNAVELVTRNRNRYMVHAADRFTRGRHRILREIEEGEQVAVPQVVEEVGRTRQVPVLE